MASLPTLPRFDALEAPQVSDLDGDFEGFAAGSWLIRAVAAAFVLKRP